MKALPLEQKQLLEIQQLDLAIARIEHTQRSYPALTTLEALKNRQNDLQNAVIAYRADLEELNRQIGEVEKETEKVHSRKALQQSRLDEGKVPMRDMSALEHEIRNMGERVGELEAKNMELMEKAERVDEIISAAISNASMIQRDEEAAQAEVEAALAKSNAEIEQLRTKRQHLVDSLPESLVDEYAHLRERIGPVVIVEVRDGHAVSSPIEFSAVDLSKLSAMPADQIFVHEDSEMLVVRTSSE